MNHGDNNITVIDEEGNEQLCEVLFTFDSEEFGNNALWTRKKDDFMAMAERDGKSVPRFKYIEDI